MYRNSYQQGMVTIFFSVGSKPLAIWDTHMQDGYISRFLDQDIKSMVLEIRGTNVSTTYITCPKGNMVLGISMPYLVMIVKNLRKYFSFEVTILDETKTRRRFRASNFQSNTQILPLCTVMPIGLAEGWNQIQFNLAEFTRRAYKKQFVEVQKLKINANIRLRRIYFAERLMPDDQLPPEYKLFFPLASKAKSKNDNKANDEKAKPDVNKEESLIKSVDKLESMSKVVDMQKSISKVIDKQGSMSKSVEKLKSMSQMKQESISQMKQESVSKGMDRQESMSKSLDVQESMSKVVQEAVVRCGEDGGLINRRLLPTSSSMETIPSI